MVETADVVIVGGGVNGMATAYALAGWRAGRVMLIEHTYNPRGAAFHGHGLTF